MARPPKALAQVEGHLTKAQRETRESAEKQLSSDEKIEMSAAVKKSKVAKDLFKRVTGLLDSIGMDDAFYEPVINRYCVMTAECETLEHDLQRTEELLDTLDSWLRCMGNQRRMARELHLHYNTVGYRLQQLWTLLAADPADPVKRLALETALYLYRYRRV